MTEVWTSITRNVSCIHSLLSSYLFCTHCARRSETDENGIRKERWRTRNGDFGVRLAAYGYRFVMTSIRAARTCAHVGHSQMLQVAIIPRHFTVEAAATFNQVAAHQESVVSVAQPVRVGTVLSGRPGSVRSSRIFLHVQRRCAERAAPLNSAYASLPVNQKENRFLFLHLTGLNISIDTVLLKETQKTEIPMTFCRRTGCSKSSRS